MQSINCKHINFNICEISPNSNFISKTIGSKLICIHAKWRHTMTVTKIESLKKIGTLISSNLLQSKLLYLVHISNFVKLQKLNQNLLLIFKILKICWQPSPPPKLWIGCYTHDRISKNSITSKKYNKRYFSHHTTKEGM